MRPTSDEVALTIYPFTLPPNCYSTCQICDTQLRLNCVRFSHVCFRRQHEWQVFIPCVDCTCCITQRPKYRSIYYFNRAHCKYDCTVKHVLLPFLCSQTVAIMMNLHRPVLKLCEDRYFLNSCNLTACSLQVLCSSHINECRLYRREFGRDFPKMRRLYHQRVVKCVLWKYRIKKCCRNFETAFAVKTCIMWHDLPAL